jgi:hypothetical protein
MLAKVYSPFRLYDRQGQNKLKSEMTETMPISTKLNPSNLNWKLVSENKSHSFVDWNIIRPCVVDSMFQVPWPPELGACALPTQHKVDFQHSTFLLLTFVDVCLKFVLRIFKILNERSMSSAFSIAMHCICLQAGRPKWVCAQDPKHRINYARPKKILV